MADPLTNTAAGITLAAATATVPVITLFGVPLGLRPDVLIAGFAGALAAMALFNTVPGTGDTWWEMVRTALRRMGVALTSSLTAGYLTPLALLMANVPDSLLMAGAFVVGGSAQEIFARAIKLFRGKESAETSTTAGDGK